MRRILYILIPFLMVIAIFAVAIFFLSQNKEKGALQVTSTPSANVYLDGKLIGKTPLCKAPFCSPPDSLKSGTYIIKLIPTSGDFQPFEQQITINPKVLTVIDRSFAPTGLASASVIDLVQIDDKKDAQISVVSFPDNVQVYLDNDLSGQTPILLKNITESDHELKLTKPGYKDKIVRIRTVDGYKLETLVLLGIDPDIATKSATPATSLSSTPSATIAITPKIVILDTPTGFLRVRDQASLGGAEVGQVHPGETFDLLDEKTGWFQIKLQTGIKGWVSAQYAQKQS